MKMRRLRLDFVMKTEHVRPTIATGSTCPTDARNGRRSRDGRRLRSATTDGRNAWNASNATIWNATDGRLLRLSKTKIHLYHSGIRLRLLQNCDRYSYGMFPCFSDFIGVDNNLVTLPFVIIFFGVFRRVIFG